MLFNIGEYYTMEWVISQSLWENFHSLENFPLSMEKSFNTIHFINNVSHSIDFLKSIYKKDSTLNGLTML